MREGWITDRFENCLKLKSGDGLTAKNMKPGDYPVYGGNGIAGYHNQSNLSGKHIVIGRVGALCGIARLIDEEIWLTDNAFKISEFKYEFDHHFLTYLLNYLNLRGYARQAAQPVISNSSLKDVVLIFPTNLPEQQQIVSILDRAFAAIDQAKANLERNIENAKELFQSKLESIFSELMDDTIKISDLAQVKSGFSFKSKDFLKEGKFQVIRMGNVRPGIVRLNESPVFINEMDEKVKSKALLQKGDVIITQTGTKKKRDYGYTTVIETSNLLLNQRIAALRFQKGFDPYFFLYYSWTNHFRDQYFANETGTVGQGNVGIGAVKDSFMPNIDSDQSRITVEKIRQIETDINNYQNLVENKLSSLEELKKSILQRAFSGELTKDFQVEEELAMAAEPEGEYKK